MSLFKIVANNAIRFCRASSLQEARRIAARSMGAIVNIQQVHALEAMPGNIGVRYYDEAVNTPEQAIGNSRREQVAQQKAGPLPSWAFKAQEKQKDAAIARLLRMAR